MPPCSTRDERAAIAADPMTVTYRLKRKAFCPACGIGLASVNLCWITGHAFCKACGPDVSFLVQAAIQHLHATILAPFIVYTDGLIWFTPPPENLRGETIFAVLDTVLRDSPAFPTTPS